MKIPIKTNVYFIPERLRDIDSNYFVVFNTDRGKFEVHYKGQPGGTYCFTVPYEELDSRTIELLHQTRVEHSEKIISDMDRYNEQLEKRRYNRLMDEAAQRAKAIHQYARGSEHREAIPEDGLKEFAQ